VLDGKTDNPREATTKGKMCIAIPPPHRYSPIPRGDDDDDEKPLFRGLEDSSSDAWLV